MFEVKIKDIKGYEFVKYYYYVTKFGRIISYRTGKACVMAHRLSGVGYYYALLATDNGGTLQELVSRIVASAFISNNNITKTIVHHKDSNKLNNHYTNLQWVTEEENIRYALLEKNIIDGQISFLEEYKPEKKYIVMPKIEISKKQYKQQLSLADIC